MKVLIACEFSGIVRDAFAKRGHNAWSVDLLPTERPGQHYQGSVLDMAHYFGEHWRWDLMIAHPPCTYLCNSGVRWLYERPERWELMYQAAIFFRKILRSRIGGEDYNWVRYYIPKIAVENPIPHRYATEIIGSKYDQIIHPWQFGHGETKATCLWLRGLPKLRPTNVVQGRKARVHKESPRKNRWKNRSRTYQGIADAMAEQWG